MEKISMTALISAFARAYHSINSEVRIFDDSIAARMLSKEEYEEVSACMAEGTAYFNPAFKGTPSEALRWIAENYLCPSPVGRAAFIENALKNAVRAGAEQYIIFAAGYDTFACRRPEWAKKLRIFEIDRACVIKDKQKRLCKAGIESDKNTFFIGAELAGPVWENGLISERAFDPGAVSFCSLAGLLYYLSKQDFAVLLKNISRIVPEGSALAFDYPDENSFGDKAGERAKKQAALAGAAGEAMRACYSYADMERMLCEAGFLIYEHLTPDDITQQYFCGYNAASPAHRMTAFDNVNYCLAVKKHCVRT